MKKILKKRVAAFALALTMAFTSMPMSTETAWAEETGSTEVTEGCESHEYGEDGNCIKCKKSCW